MPVILGSIFLGGIIVYTIISCYEVSKSEIEKKYKDNSDNESDKNNTPTIKTT